MIKQAAYGTEPWRLVEKEFDLSLLAQSESIFALSNGHIGLRGNLDEGDPHGLPGTYLNSMYEVRPLPYAEAGYGFPDQRPDRHQRHQRQDHPAAGRRRAVRHQVRHPALPRAHPRPAGGHADQERRLVLPGRGPDQGDLGADGVADPARGRRDQLHGRAGRPDAAAGAAVRAGHQRGDAGAGQRSPPGRHPGIPAGQRGTPDCTTARRRGSCWCTGRKASGLRMAAGMSARDHTARRRWPAAPSPMPIWAGPRWRSRSPAGDSCA